MKRPIWAVMLGAFRQEFELYTTLAYLVELREKGKIDGILASTWCGEADRFCDLRKKLRSLQIELIETEPLLEDSPYGNLNYLRQATQMKAALAVLPQDAVILKCRTDFSNFDFNRIDMLRETIRLPESDGFGDFTTGLSRKLAVMRYGVTCPFTFHDVTYLGTYQDLRCLCTTDNSNLSIGMDVWPDVWLFAPFFVTHYPIIEDFYRYIDHYSFQRLMLNLDPDEELDLPSALNKFYAVYFAILYQSFTIFHEEPFPENRELSLTDLFSGCEGSFLRRSWLVEVRNDGIIERVVDGKLKDTKGYRKLYEEIQRVKTAGYAESLFFTPEDYEELKEWGKTLLGADPEEWLRPYRKIKADRKRNDQVMTNQFSDDQAGFMKAVDLLFDEYRMDEEEKEAIRDISYNKESYYGSIIASLPLFQEKSESLYRKALFNAARYTKDTVIRRIAELLMTGDLTEGEQAEALYPFQRYAYEDRLYGFPMTEDRVRGLYTYCLYEEREEDDPVVRREWFRRLKKEYQGEEIAVDGEIVTMEELRDLLRSTGYWYE